MKYTAILAALFASAQAFESSDLVELIQANGMTPTIEIADNMNL